MLTVSNSKHDLIRSESRSVSCVESITKGCCAGLDSVTVEPGS
jgi:hypothetical protein